MRCGEVIIHDLAVTTRKWKRVFGNKKTDLPRLVLSSADTTSSQSHVLHFKKMVQFLVASAEADVCYCAERTSELVPQL